MCDQSIRSLGGEPPLAAKGKSTPPAISAWQPHGPVQQLHRPTLDCVDILAIGGNGCGLKEVWEKYAADPSLRTREWTAEFVHAVLLLSRRCPTSVSPVLNELAQAPELLDEDLVRLAAVIAEFSNAAAGQTLFRRCKGRKMRSAFYHALLKLFSECSCCNTEFAMAIAKEMDDQQVPHSAMSARYILHGLSKQCMQSAETLTTAMNMMTWRLEQSSGGPLSPPNAIEGCFLHQFCAVFEMTPKNEVARAVAYLDELEKRAPGIFHHLFESLMEKRPGPPNKLYANDPDATINYVLVDAFSIQGEWLRGYTIPPYTYLLFLSSQVRELVLRARDVADDHPLKVKLGVIRSLLKDNPRTCFLCPLRKELAARGDLPGKWDNASCTAECNSAAAATQSQPLPPPPACSAFNPPPHTAHWKLLQFVDAVTVTMHSCCAFHVVTTDLSLQQCLKNFDKCQVDNQLPR